jgi:hypothetical protein
MAPDNVLPELSESTIQRLLELRSMEDKEEFYLHIASLRRNSWPLRAIAEPLGVSRSIVNIWETKIDPLAPLPEVEALPKQISEQVKPIYSKYELSEEDSRKLWHLAREASKVRRYTDPDSPSREAARELEDLLHYHKERGASLNTLKNACGVSRRAVAQRLEKRDKSK